MSDRAAAEAAPADQVTLLFLASSSSGAQRVSSVYELWCIFFRPRTSRVAPRLFGLSRYPSITPNFSWSPSTGLKISGGSTSFLKSMKPHYRRMQIKPCGHSPSAITLAAAAAFPYPSIHLSSAHICSFHPCLFEHPRKSVFKSIILSTTCALRSIFASACTVSMKPVNPGTVSSIPARSFKALIRPASVASPRCTSDKSSS